LLHGKNCTKAHTAAEARELTASAPRDPAPWIAAVEATMARLEEAVRRANDKTLSKEMRAHWANIAHMIKSIELLALQEIGPERYEIPRPHE
jgi:hypothetical protein